MASLDGRYVSRETSYPIIRLPAQQEIKARSIVLFTGNEINHQDTKFKRRTKNRKNAAGRSAPFKSGSTSQGEKQKNVAARASHPWIDGPAEARPAIYCFCNMIRIRRATASVRFTAYS